MRECTTLRAGTVLCIADHVVTLRTEAIVEAESEAMAEIRATVQRTQDRLRAERDPLYASRPMPLERD